MTLNKSILEQITKLNAFKDKGYRWDKSGKTSGSIGDVLWDGKVVLKGAEDQTSYCCGVTLQAYLMACAAVGKHLGDFTDVMAIYRKWFIIETKSGVPVHDNKGPADALVPRGHGLEVSLDKAEPGDLCQIWRKSGSGHSVIFINYFTENGVKALKYWSSQPSTNGVGYRTEYFDGVKNPITHAWVCRPI